MQNIITNPNSIIIAVAVMVFLVLITFAQNILLKRRLKQFFRSASNLNIESVLRDQIKKTEKLEGETRRLLEETLAIRETLKNAVQKAAVKRFSSFDESSGNQSFTIAMLDDKNNGFILTGLQLREQMRMLAKPVEKGVAQSKLSQEEEGVLSEAIGK